MKNLPLLLGTIVLSLALVLGIGYWFARLGTPGVATADRMLLESNPTQSQGASESAKVTIVEFSDFQCPACRATAPLVKSVVAQNTANVRLIFRYFPLVQIHKNSEPATRAAQAAGNLGKFWEMHDLLFEKQDEWAAIAESDKLAQQFQSYATGLGLDGSTFQEQYRSNEVEQIVNRDMSLGEQVQITGTPTFFVNGVATRPNDLEATVKQAVGS